MSTTFDWRDVGMRSRDDATADAVERRPARRAAPARAASPGEPIPLRRPAGVRRSGQSASRAVAVRLRQRVDRARLVAAAIIGLSILGLVYLTQISHVARYGYLLSDLQRDQDRVARENQLLEYQITAAHNLTQVDDLAVKSYGMQPIVQLPATGGASRASAQGTPQARYVTVRRPAVVAPTPPAPPAPVGLIDRLLNQLVGIGVAGAER